MDFWEHLLDLAWVRVFFRDDLMSRYYSVFGRYMSTWFMVSGLGQDGPNEKVYIEVKVSDQ